MLRDTAEFKRGRSGEQIVAERLKRKGCFIIPSYDYSGEDNDKPPRLQGLLRSAIIPDLDVSRAGRRIWVEVKTKRRADWTRVTQRLEHGISLRHYNEYLDVQAITGTAVWLAIYEEETGDVLVQKLADLAAGARVYTGWKMGRDGMVYFPRDAFRTISAEPSPLLTSEPER
jgi:hypothetical protein